MRPGIYNIEGHDVTVGYIGTNFEDAMITILIGRFDPELALELPDKTPQDYLPIIVSTAIASRQAKEIAKDRMNHYAKHN